MNDFYIKVLKSDELESYFNLRYSTYLKLKYIEENKEKLDIDEYDQYSIPFGAFDANNKLIGCVRLITDKIQNNIEQLKINKINKFHLPSIINQNVEDCFKQDSDRKIFEISRGIILDEYKSLHIYTSLMYYAISYAFFKENPIFIGSCLEKHVPMYNKYGYISLENSDIFGLLFIPHVKQMAKIIVCNLEKNNLNQNIKNIICDAKIKNEYISSYKNKNIHFMFDNSEIKFGEIK